MTTPPAKDGNGAAARPDGVSLLDKVTFFSWAADTHRLDGSELNILRVVVFDLLGLEDGKPHNAWTTRGVLATACYLHKRTVERALDRLNELGLVKHFGVAGRGGRTLLHVPGIVGAAKLLKRRPLHDGTKGEAEPNGHDESADASSKRRRPRRLKSVEKAASVSAKRRRPRRLNPLNESLEGSEPLEGVSGGAANPPPGEPPALSLEEGQGGAFGGEGGTLTRARQRLRSRIVGEAKKLGLQDGGARFLRHATEVTVQDWLRWQREERDQRLVQAIWQALVDEYGLDAEEAGRLLASKAEPKPPPESARPLASEAKPPPPPASSSPSRPPPAVSGGLAPHPALRTVAAAIHKPVLRPPPACRIVYNAEVLQASAANLGIPRKGAAS
jgi:hypothetical protein